MRPEELTSLLNRRPFRPLRIHITGGATYDVRHPENVMVLRDRVDIAVDRNPTTGVVDHVDFVSLVHIVRVEDMPAFVPPETNGPTS